MELVGWYVVVSLSIISTSHRIIYCIYNGIKCVYCVLW